MQYEDFVIDIRSINDGKFEAYVLESPLPERPRTSFTPPLDELAVDRLRQVIADEVRSTQSKGQPEVEKTPTRQDDGEVPRQSLREIGRMLYRSLFSGDVGRAFDACRSALSRDRAVGLRVRLLFYSDDSMAEYLAALPWELLCHSGTGEFLAGDIRTPVIRQFAGIDRGETLRVDGPLRILVVDAAPRNMKKIDLRSEVDRLEEALRVLTAAGEVELLQLEESTPEAMREALRDEGVHVLHFMGHAGFHEPTGTGALFFVKSDGSAHQIDGEILGSLLIGIPELRLVFLNACQTARHKGRFGAPLYYGAASGILELARIPAVVANQHAISDAGAIALSEVVYRRIAAGDPVDTAISEARLQLRLRTKEWATPVIFMSSGDGRLFSREQMMPKRTVRVLARKPVADPDSVHLGILSFIGWGKGMGGRLCDLTQFFDPEVKDGRYIRDPQLWQTKVFPELRGFLAGAIREDRPLHLDFAAHHSIAFAAGWVLEAKSGLDIRVKQRTQGGSFDWHPNDDTAPTGLLWQQRDDVELGSGGPDIAVAITATNAKVREQAQAFIERAELPVGRIIDAVVPEPGQLSIKGGQHALRLAQALANRMRQKRPHERGGRIHIFGAVPNALLFYLGQLSRSLGRIVLYEYAFSLEDNYGRYQRSIELPPPDEATPPPPGW